MPSMVLLIPAILFFGLGTSAGVVATLIFALAPGVRMTELGIRQVDAELVEAAEAFGTSPRDTLLRVQLPLALPTIMAGVNQVIMLGLSMVVIAGMVGTGGLGGAVNEAIGQLDIGFGFEAGVGIVVLAIYLDRMTSALGTHISPLGRRAAAKARAAEGAKLWNYRPRPAFAVIGVVVLALVAGGIGVFGSSSGTEATSARARRSPSATSPGTRASPPPSSGRRSWRSAATRSPPPSTPPAPSTPASPPARSTSRPTPGCPPRTPSTGRSTASSSTTSAAGTAPRPWS
jgi:ABC-type Fe3+ transport system permease subunit